MPKPRKPKLTPDQLLSHIDLLPLSFSRDNVRKAIKYLGEGWTPHQINWHWPLPLEVWERLCEGMGLYSLCKRLHEKPLNTAKGKAFSIVVLALRLRGEHNLADSVIKVIT